MTELMNPPRTIFLINPPLDGCRSSYPNDFAFPPLGVLSLATEITKKTKWRAVVYDGQITSMASIVADMEAEKPAVVGLSVLAETYRSSLDFAAAAKKIGAVTLFGNDQAALLGENILRKQPAVDMICTAEHGETSIVPLLEALDCGYDLACVPELLFRTEGGAVSKSSALPPASKGSHKMDNSPVVDRRFLPPQVWDVYKANYVKTYGFMHPGQVVTGVTTINRGRGCPRSKNRCAYCGILDLTIQTSSPSVFWKEVECAREQIAANVFYEVFDSMSSVPRWVSDLVQQRPERLSDSKFIVYAQAREVTEQLVELFKQLGVVMVNMGLDSGDDTMLKRLKGPCDSVEANRRAVQLISAAGMHVFCSFVLGAPGENEESLQRTIAFTKWLADNRLAAAIEAQPLMPRVRAKVGEWFCSPAKAEEDMTRMGLTLKNSHLLSAVSEAWKTEDIIDTPVVSKIYAEVFTDVTYSRLVDAANEIVEYAKSKGLGSGSVGMEVGK